jgi:predicted amidohydrolase
MLIACVQSDVTFAEPQANLSRVIDWMNRAAEGSERKAQRPADLVVFPECMLTGYTFESRQQAEQTALTLDDPIFSALAEHAERRSQVISLGFLQRSGERLYNAAALIGPQGVIANYQKVHLPHLGVDRFVDPGRQPYGVQVIETPRGRTAKIGMAICYDASFPEPIRVLALDGAQVIALGTNWPVEATHTARIVPPARSMENHLYFVAANRVGRENEFTFCGRSSICGPDGVVLASSGDDRETILFADVDPELADNKRIERSPGIHTIDRFADRRPEFYDRLTRPLNSPSR